jgi:ketosteroid isomerase-like protein
MDAQGTMRLMSDTMDAYDRGDFDRLAEIYAKDARWINNVDPGGPHCRNRDDIFSMFRQRMNSAAPSQAPRLSGGGVAGDSSRVARLILNGPSAQQ